jgi:PAS domain S-box-containing protein
MVPDNHCEERRKPDENAGGTSPSSRSIRDAAEKAIAGFPEKYSDQADQAPAELIHELRVHQVELEMQNEELIRTRLNLEESCNRYIDLYDRAPVGYLTTNEKGLIVKANLTAATLLNMDRTTLIKKPITRFIEPGDQNLYSLHVKALAATKQQQSLELRMLRHGASSFWAGIILVPSPEYERDGAGEGTGCNLIVIDITERKAREEKLELMFKENGMLLSEIHHRVRNNLQMVLSAMERERRKEPDERVQVALIRTESRLATISFVFDRVYQSKNVTSVRFLKVIQSIISRLSELYSPDKQRITIKVLVQDVELGIDLAIPLALIANELVSNAIQHAFTGGRSGQISISACEKRDNIIFAVLDNGAGFPAGVVPEEAISTGFTQVRLLAGQIHGTLRHETSAKGTSWVMTVPREAKSDTSGVKES